MCVVSMVMDYYQPKFPGQRDTLTYPWARQIMPEGLQPIQPDYSELRKLISEFREAVEAAKKVDVLTAQPDCEDPEKIQLVERVAELERQLDAVRGVVGMPEPQPPA